jgi:hypothetical protein
VPKLDFTFFCPMPIAYGISLMLKAHGSLPSPWVGLVIYFALVAAFWRLQADSERIGKPERQRQREAILHEPQAALPEVTADPATDDITAQEEPRQRLFFWLGVFVLPVFWSWFTLGRTYTRSQRVVAFTWLALLEPVNCWARGSGSMRGC